MKKEKIVYVYYLYCVFLMLDTFIKVIYTVRLTYEITFQIYSYD